MEHSNTFAGAIASGGFNPPDHIEPGTFYRYPGADKRPSNKAGYCFLFDDGKGGVFGDFSTGHQETWQADGNSTAIDAETLRQIRIARQQHKAAIKIRWEKIAVEANQIWSVAATEIIHPYPINKKFTPYGARQADNALLVPMYFGGKLINLQRIFPNTEGNNKFPLKGGRVTGCYFPIGELSDHLYICEGYATACSLHEYTGVPVAVAFNADGLKPVAITIRKKYPDLKITVACDNDHQTPGNPGLTKGRAAAAAVGGDVIYPDFTDEAFDGTDYNDYLTQGGAL